MLVRRGTSSSIDVVAPPHDRPAAVYISRTHQHSNQEGVSKGSDAGKSVRRLLQSHAKTKTTTNGNGRNEKHGQTKMKTKETKGNHHQKKITMNKVQPKTKKRSKTTSSKMTNAYQQKKAKGNYNESKSNNKMSNGENEDKKKKKMMMTSNVQKKTKKTKDDKNDDKDTKKEDEDDIDDDEDVDDADPTSSSSPTLMPTLSPTLEPTPSPPTLALTTNDDEDETTNETNNNNNLDENNDNVVNNETVDDDKSSASRRSSPRYTPELCLSSQNDSYRTCYQRQNIDPTTSLSSSSSSSSIKCDSITNRKEYVPFTKPYVTNDEELITGTVVLTMLLSDDTTTTTAASTTTEDELNCRESFKLEETVLTYLSDNIGSERTFTPVCVYLEKYVYSSSRGEVGGGRTLALEFEVTYIHNKIRNTSSSSSRNNERRMLGYEKWMHPLKLEMESIVGLDLSEVNPMEVVRPGEQISDRIVEGSNNNRGLRKTKKTKKSKSKLKIGKGKKKKMMSNVQTNDDDDLDSTDDAVNDYNDDEAEDDDEAFPTLMPTTAEEDKVEGEEVDKEYTNTKECTAIQTALCCSQLAINAASPPPGRGGTRAGIYCDSLDCSFRKQCGTGRMSSQNVIIEDRVLQVTRKDVNNKENFETTNTVSGGGGRKDCSPFFFPTANPTWFDNYKGRSVNKICPAYGMLKAQDFNEAIRCITKIKIQDRSNYADAFHGSRSLERIKSAPVYAELNVRSLESASYCSLNRYSLQQQGKPILSCEEFENEYECQVSQGNKNLFGTNDDILPYVDTITEDGVVCTKKEDEDNIDDDEDVDDADPTSSSSPTLMPTLSPSTLEPTPSPPTLAPTLIMPTLSPTLTPTLSPETTRVKPTKKPSKKPTKKPSNKPTTLSPSTKPSTASPSSKKPIAVTAAPSKATSTAAPSKTTATAKPISTTAAPSKTAATAKPNPTATAAPSKATDTKKPTSTTSPSKAAETLKPTTSPSKATETLKPTAATISPSNGTATLIPTASPANSTSLLLMM